MKDEYIDIEVVVGFEDPAKRDEFFGFLESHGVMCEKDGDDKIVVFNECPKDSSDEKSMGSWVVTLIDSLYTPFGGSFVHDRAKVVSFGPKGSKDKYSFKKKESDMKRYSIEKSIRIPGTNIILEKGDVVTLNKVDEAFKAGSSADIVKKMCGIIARRLDTTVVPSMIPTETKTADGKFCTYYCVYGGKKIFAINFKLGGSDEIYSVSLCDNTKKHWEPTTDILLNGFNIVDVIDQICDILDGNVKNYKEKAEESVSDKLRSFKARRPFREAGSIRDGIAKWLQSDQNLMNNLGNKKYDWSNHIADYNKFAAQNSCRTFGGNEASFQWTIRQVALHDINGVPVQQVSKAIPGVTVQPAAQPISVGQPAASTQDKLIDEVMNEGYMQKWLTFKDYVYLVVNQYRTVMVAYGMPGTGKSFNARKDLEDLGLSFVEGKNVCMGATKPDALMSFLYENKDEPIVVFDDCDSIFAKGAPNMANHIKNIFGASRVRTVGLNKEFVSTLDKNVKVPATFQIQCGIICLTNKQADELNPAVLDRSLSVELNFSPAEMLDMIKSKIYEMVAPNGDPIDLTDAERDEVFDFYVEIKPRLKVVNMRSFAFALQTREIAKALGEDTIAWHKRVVRALQHYVIPKN